MKIIRWIAYINLMMVILFFTYFFSIKFYNEFKGVKRVFTPKVTASSPLTAPPFPKEAKIQGDWVKILVVEAGGIHGLMPLKILEYLEKKTGKPAAKLFHLFSGTSTGAIIVSALTFPSFVIENKPRYSAADILDLYEEFGVHFLKPGFLNALLTFNGLLGPDFSGEKLDRLLEKTFPPPIRYNQLLDLVMIPLFNINHQKTEFFKSWECGCGINPDYYVHQILSAATAVPGIFYPVLLKDLRSGVKGVYVDAGLTTFNPSLQTYQIVRDMFPNKKYFFLVLGTGQEFEELPGNEAQRWGTLKWVRHLLKILLTAQIKTQDRAMSILQKELPEGKLVFEIFNRVIQTNAFQVSQKDVTKTLKESDKLILEEKKRLDAIADFLLEH